MPSNKIISEKLKTAWVNAGGSHNDKPPLNLHLYWGKKDVNNHIHIFQEEDSTLSYNIKCYGNGGNSRIKHSVDPYQSMKDFIEELQTNWRQECPNFIDDFESGGTTQQQQEYQPQQQQQHQQYQQYQQPKQRNQQQSSDMDWEYKYLKYKQKYLELKKMLDKKHFNS